jgi:guanyl-specific ribonuclease Sa
MRRHVRKPWIWLVAALVLLAWLLWPRPVASPTAGPERDAAPAVADAAPSIPGRAARADAPPLPDFLPAEAAPVVARILDGSAHPHPQDGSTFFNRESHLPDRPRGYYREYTVPTPGLGHRGARRIVTGGRPPVDWYYSDDHYDSFRRFEVAP